MGLAMQDSFGDKARLEYLKMAHAEYLEALKATKEFSSSSVNMLFILNGGAIVALLAFLGNVYGKPEGAIALRLAKEMVPAIPWLIGGVALAALTSGIAYINFSALHAVVPSATHLLEWARGEKFDQPPRLRYVPTASAYFGLLTASLSLGAFCWAAYLVFSGFRTVFV